MKENLRFKQSYKQPKQTNKKRTPKISNKLYQTKCVCQTDAVYVLSTIKLYSYFSFVFSTMPKKVGLVKI